MFERVFLAAIALSLFVSTSFGFSAIAVGSDEYGVKWSRNSTYQSSRAEAENNALTSCRATLGDCVIATSFVNACSSVRVGPQPLRKNYIGIATTEFDARSLALSNCAKENVAATCVSPDFNEIAKDRLATACDRTITTSETSLPTVATFSQSDLCSLETRLAKSAEDLAAQIAAEQDLIRQADLRQQLSNLPNDNLWARLAFFKNQNGSKPFNNFTGKVQYSANEGFNFGLRVMLDCEQASPALSVYTKISRGGGMSDLDRLTEALRQINVGNAVQVSGFINLSDQSPSFSDKQIQYLATITSLSRK